MGFLSCSGVINLIHDTICKFQKASKRFKTLIEMTKGMENIFYLPKFYMPVHILSP